MTINLLISKLIEYGIHAGLINPADKIYTTNRLLEELQILEYTEPDVTQSSGASDNGDATDIGDDAPASYDTGHTDTDDAASCDTGHTDTSYLADILSGITDYAVSQGLLQQDTVTYRDLFDTKIMGLITPPPSVVRAEFERKYNISPKEATDYYYNFSKATNYIRTDRIAKDVKWTTATDYGELDITINLSKPEKDPRDIAAAGQAKKSGYPSCLLCKENEGYSGSITHPARQNHRIVPIKLAGENYYLQYSPYVYYNEHCIIFNENHIPMKIDKDAFVKLLDFTAQFPHYTAGSNADLPIVGGSILSHDHFQGGAYEFPMVRAPYKKEFQIRGYDEIRAGIINWPLSTIRLQGEDPSRVADLADMILSKWRSYTDEDAFIYAETDGVPHNTITPIARRRKNLFELDLVLRNNITTDEHPLGVYHPHAEYHHIKKENIGLIEVMGLAILPARLKNEMSILEETVLECGDLSSKEALSSHLDWAVKFLTDHGFTISNYKIENIPLGMSPEILNTIVKDEIGLVFSKVLEDAGVYKCTEEGDNAFMRFIDSLNK